MPVSDIYTAQFNPTVAANTSTAVGSLIAATTKRAWVIGVRCRVVTTAAAAGSTTAITLSRPGNTMTGTSLATVAAHDFSGIASISSVCSTWSTAPTISAAQGGQLAEWEMPLAAGSMWAEFPLPGAEWGVPALGNTAANTGVHLFILQSVTTSSVYSFDLIFSE